MKRRSIGDGDSSSPIDLTPMLDIVFIMLIFFIVTATFIREPGVKVEKPAVETGQPLKNVAILVAISADNIIYMDGKPVPPRDVRPTIERLRSENPKGGVVIQADEEADMGLTVLVMDEARAARAPSVSVSTIEQE
ncbi:MAG: biopolymer transporter ExbD [Alphaproteobacteria bacterium]|nr:biopolymer transporter ExbD [Alphaproteobacteria bacterium]